MDKNFLNRNNSIDIFRFVCAIMVVAIHTSPFMDQNIYLGYLFTQVIPRIAVPFFFLTSGYFYIKKLKIDNNCFKKTIYGLLKTYVLWTLIYYIIDIIFCIKNSGDIVNLLKMSLINFFIFGSHYHFWFFPALFFSIVIVTIANKVNFLSQIAVMSIALYILGVLGCSYYYLGIKIPLISLLVRHDTFILIRRVCCMGFPFFMLGYFVPKIVDKVKISVYHIIFSIIFFITEIVIVNKFYLQKNIIITLGLYIMLIIIFCYFVENPLKHYTNITKILKKLADFIYYVHPINIVLIQLIFNKSNIFVFILTVCLSVFEGMIIIRLNFKSVKK